MTDNNILKSLLSKVDDGSFRASSPATGGFGDDGVAKADCHAGVAREAWSSTESSWNSPVLSRVVGI